MITMTATSIPDGYSSLTPFLVVADGEAAIDFYTTALGATLVSRMDTPDGKVAHAELQFEDGRLQLSDAMPQIGLAAPEPGPTTTHSTVLYCSDVDSVVARAVDAGAILREEVSTFVTGDRFGSIIDPFGHRWAILTRVEDVSADEQERRLAEWGTANL
jgi:PhnB protein